MVERLDLTPEDAGMTECYCHTCDREFHSLGVSRHRAMHRDHREDCEITYLSGATYIHHYATSRVSAVIPTVDAGDKAMPDEG